MRSESGDRVQPGASRRNHAKIGKEARSGRGGSAATLPRAARNNTKHIGNLVELEFMLKAASRGFPVARPFGDNEHYDVMVDARSRIWRVQVKSAIDAHGKHYQVPSHWMAYKRLIPYTPADIDFLAAFIRRHNIWYLIPVEAIKGRLVFNVYPFGTHRRPAGEFEEYREAWHLLDPQRPEGAPS